MSCGWPGFKPLRKHRLVQRDCPENTVLYFICLSSLKKQILYTGQRYRKQANVRSHYCVLRVVCHLLLLLLYLSWRPLKKALKQAILILTNTSQNKCDCRHQAQTDILSSHNVQTDKYFTPRDRISTICWPDPLDPVQRISATWIQSQSRGSALKLEVDKAFQKSVY